MKTSEPTPRERTLELLEQRIATLMSARHQMTAALRDLYEFRVEEQHLDQGSDFYQSGDEDAPFFSEAYLYNLLGKHDARTVLAYLHAVERPLGYRDGRPLRNQEPTP